jgi:hypothetical protein
MRSEMTVPPTGSQLLWSVQSLAEWSTLGKLPSSPMTLLEAHAAMSDPSVVDGLISAFDTVGLLVLLCHISSMNEYHRTRYATHEGAHRFRALAASSLPAIGRRLNELWKDALYVHARTLYHLISISLSVPFRDLEDATNSGFSSAGSTPTAHARTAMIRLLASKKVNENPARHAVELLQLFLGGGTARLMLPLATSALYLGVLTLWAFAVGRGTEQKDMAMAQWPISDAAESLERLVRKIDQPGAECLGDWASLCNVVSGMLGTLKNSNAREYSEVLRQLTKATI